jgi:hypothetical protein
MLMTLDSGDRQSRTLWDSKFVMEIGLMMIRILKLALGAPLILAAALVVGPCRVSFAQGDADFEAPGLKPFTASVSGGTTLFQNVRILMAGAACSQLLPRYWSKAGSLSAYPQAQSPSMRMPTFGSLRRADVC